MTEVPLEDRPHTLYRFFATDGRLLYIGITANAKNRWEQHEWSKSWWLEAGDCKIEHYPNRAAVLDAEEAAIKAEQPIHNIMHNGGGVALPQHWMLPDDLPLQYTQELVEVNGRQLSFALRWQLQHGRMVCVGMRMATRAIVDDMEYPQPEGLSDQDFPITTSMLRSPAFPAAMHRQRLVLMDRLTNEITVTDTAVQVRDRRTSRMARIQAAAAAGFYLAAQASGSPAPTLAVAAAMGVSRSQASRYVRAAREAGLLPPTSPGAPQG
jgi:predicted GIY-YIG superfamily endonuclease